MQQFIYFFQKNKYALYFLLLQIVAFILIINNHNFHRSKVVSSTNAISGYIYSEKTTLRQYLHLKENNDELVAENTKLKNQLESVRYASDSLTENTVIDSLSYRQQYTYINGKVIKNEFHKPYNILTIKPGENANITQEMAVINHKGLIGVTDGTSKHYTRVKSILNKDVRINARFKHSAHFGSLQWNGEDYRIIQLTDIPRQAVYKIGDTIITGGKSAIFPEGILVGTVHSLPKELTASNTIDLKLFNDMSNIHHIYVVKNHHKLEIKQLEDADSKP